jgi:hypothetical protein
MGPLCSSAETQVCHRSYIITATWRTINDTIKRVLIWRFALVLIKINYGQIGDQTGLVKTDVGQVDLVLRCPTGQLKKSDSQTCRYDGQIYFHWYKILGLLYKRALFDLQFVHNLF